MATVIIVPPSLNGQYEIIARELVKEDPIKICYPGGGAASGHGWQCIKRQFGPMLFDEENTVILVGKSDDMDKTVTTQTTLIENGRWLAAQPGLSVFVVWVVESDEEHGWYQAWKVSPNGKVRWVTFDFNKIGPVAIEL